MQDGGNEQVHDDIENNQDHDDSKENQGNDDGRPKTMKIFDNQQPPVEVQQNMSSSTASTQDDSTEEMDFDDETIKEAEVGGYDILSVFSTSKLSASAGMPENDFLAMQESDPAAALSLLLTKKWAQSQTSSEQTQSASTHSDSEVRSNPRQDSLLLKLHADYVQKDVFQSIVADPTSAFRYLNFLYKLHNPLTDSETLGKVIQLGALIDQYAKAIQRKNNNASKLDAKKKLMLLCLKRPKLHKVKWINSRVRPVELAPRCRTANKTSLFGRVE
jgi:hypothetical protein